MGDMQRKKAIFFIVFLIVVILGSGNASSGFSIWPGKLTISMYEDFPDHAIYYTFQVNNNNPYDVNITMEIKDPVPYLKKEGYTNIPDLSWVKINQSVVYIRAGESKFVDVYVDIPDSQKQLNYNKNWEVWIQTTEEQENGTEGTAMIIPAVALRIFINTPKKEQIENNGYFIFFFFCLIIIATIIYIYTKRRMILKFRKKQGIFYFNKKNKNI